MCDIAYKGDSKESFQFVTEDFIPVSIDDEIFTTSQLDITKLSCDVLDALTHDLDLEDQIKAARSTSAPKFSLFKKPAYPFILIKERVVCHDRYFPNDASGDGIARLCDISILKSAGAAERDLETIHNGANENAVLRIKNKALEKCSEAPSNKPFNLRTDVVLKGNVAATLAHEIGHRLSAEHRFDDVFFSEDRIGEQLTHQNLTMIEGGDQTGLHDDENNPDQVTTLIEKGFLRRHYNDVATAKWAGTVSTGNGRKGPFYDDRVMPRMMNTRILPDKNSEAAIIGSVQDGLYVVGCVGGSAGDDKICIDGPRFYPIVNGYVVRGELGVQPQFYFDKCELLQSISMIGKKETLSSGYRGRCGAGPNNCNKVDIAAEAPMIKLSF